MKNKSLKLNALLNVIKQSCSILFPLITFPYISRTLGGAGFGAFNFSSSIVTYFSYIAALGIGTYATREGSKIRDDLKKVNQFCSEIFSINILSMIMSYILLFLFLCINNKVSGYYSYILILSLAILIDTIGADWVNSIYENYTYITLRYIVFQMISLCLLFLFVRNENDVMIYCIVNLIAAHAGNLFNLFYVRRKVKIRFTFKMQFGLHIVPLLILFFNSLAIVIYVNADITMLGFFYSDEVVGIYSFASKIYNILKNLINATVIVTLPRFSYIKKNKPELISVYLDKICSALLYSMIPAVVGMFCMSSNIILILGGEEYLEGNLCLRILSIAIIFAILASICSNCILIVNEQERKCLISTIASAIINIVLNALLLPSYGIEAAALTTLTAELTNFLIQLFFSIKYLHIENFKMKKQVPIIVGSVFIVIICYIINMNCSSVSGLIIAVILSCLAYFVITVVLRHEIAIMIIQIIKKFLNRIRYKL